MQTNNGKVRLLIWTMASFHRWQQAPFHEILLRLCMNPPHKVSGSNLSSQGTVSKPLLENLADEERLCDSAPWRQVCFIELSSPISERGAQHWAGAQEMSKWITRSSFSAISVLPSVRMREKPSRFDFLQHSSRHLGEERACLSWAHLFPWTLCSNVSMYRVAHAETTRY